MAGYQEAYAGTSFSVIVNVIDDSGAHVAADPSIDAVVYNSAGGDTGWLIQSVTTIATGIYQINWSGVSIAENEKYTVSVTGGIGGVSWTPYGIALLVRALERGTDNVDTSGLSTFNASTDEVTTDAASRTASQANVAALATQAELDKVPKKDVAHTYSSATDSADVTITEV